MQEIISPKNTQGGNADAGGGLIKESSMTNFVADVIEASHRDLVLVDFWAPWCGPCKQLTPILEKLVRALRGVRLVKINVDANQALAAQMNVQSIPAVYAFRDGRPVDGFMGVLPEKEVRAFITRLGGESSDDREIMLGEAESALSAGDLGQAAQIFGSLLRDDSQDSAALAGLARCYVAAGDLDKARETLSMVTPAIAGKADIMAAKASLELAEKSANAGEIGPLEARLTADPTDHQARIDLAIALNSKGNREAAAEQLLESIRRARDWNEESARKQLLEFFDSWGPMDKATIQGRRHLSQILFS